MGQKKYICIFYNKKYLHEFIDSHKNLIQSKKSLQESGLRLSFCNFRYCLSSECFLGVGCILLPHERRKKALTS